MMRSLHKKLFLIVIIFFVFFVIGGNNQSKAKISNLTDNNLNNELVVKLKSGGLYKVIFDSNNIDDILQSYLANPEVEYVEPNYRYYISDFPNDTYYRDQVYLRKIQAKKAYSKELLEKQLKNITNRSVIAIIDTGVYLDHPDLKDNLWQNNNEIANNKIDDDNNGFIDDVYGWDFVSNTADPNPKFTLDFTSDAINHGTVIAGFSSARGHNEEGIIGVSADSQIMSLRALDSTGSGSIFDVIKAIKYARENGADIINMSFVGLDYSQLLYDEIKAAYDSGVMIVAAAGNTDSSIQGINLDDVKSYPVCYDSPDGKNLVLGVASVDISDNKSTFSNFGNDCIDISAPGENFFGLGVYNKEHYGYDKYYRGYWSGTSVSAPLISGSLAVLKSLNRNISNEELYNIVLDSADNIDINNPKYKGQLGSGRLNLFNSVQTLLTYHASKKARPKQTDKDNYMIAGLGLGSTPQVKIFDLDSKSYIRGFYPYDVKFGGAINVVSADTDGDGEYEIITTPGAGGSPLVKIFDQYGNTISEFFAYNPKFKGGVNLAVADINNDGIDEIITAAGPSGGPHVRIFDRRGNIISEFFAYNASYDKGIYVAAGDVDGDNIIDIITGSGPGYAPEIRIFNNSGKLKKSFYAFNKNSKVGVVVAAGDVNGNGRDEIITGIAKSGLPSVRVFNSAGYRLYSFFAFETNFYDGLNLNSFDIDGDNIDEIIVGKGEGGAPEIRIFSRNGIIRKEILGHSQAFRGGVRPAVIMY